MVDNSSESAATKSVVNFTVDGAILTEEQVHEFREVFEMFDNDGEGAIDAQELATVMRALGQNPTQAELEEMVKRVDSDGSGQIEFEEFLQLMAIRIKEDDTEEGLIEAFKVFDRDQGGDITNDELREVMRSLGSKMDEEDIDEMVRKMDFNGDGVIDYAEFCKVLYFSMAMNEKKEEQEEENEGEAPPADSQAENSD